MPHSTHNRRNRLSEALKSSMICLDAKRGTLLEVPKPWKTKFNLMSLGIFGLVFWRFSNILTFFCSKGYDEGFGYFSHWPFPFLLVKNRISWTRGEMVCSKSELSEDYPPLASDLIQIHRSFQDLQAAVAFEDEGKFTSSPDMALGLDSFFLPPVSDFWRRWHITP